MFFLASFINKYRQSTVMPHREKKDQERDKREVVIIRVFAERGMGRGALEPISMMSMEA
jgi:hypothetical protein